MTWDRVVAWNCKVGRDPATVCDNLHALIKDTDPDVLCLQEAQPYVKAIVDRFGHKHGGGWYVYQHKDWDESAMCPVMVRAKGRDQQKRGKGWDTLRTTTQWVGPQGGSHKGRTWTWVHVNDAVVMSLHRCTDGNGRNKAAFHEEADTLKPWINAQDCPVLIIGDHNCGPNKTHKGASRNIADNTGSKLAVPDAGGIDYAIRHGLTGAVKQGKCYGSDHECVWFNRDY